MPVQYATIVEEHRAVRTRVGLFDISHMGRLSVTGEGGLPWLERVTTNHVARLADGQIQYSLITNEPGGVIDDILVYRQGASHLVVCNASNRANVVRHLEHHRPGAAASLSDVTTSTAMFAIQGPRASETLAPLCNVPLRPLAYYHVTPAVISGGIDAAISRTGYTGEDGFEVIVGVEQAADTWNTLLAAGKAHGIVACGLGARDTLRLEAGMPLYGHELSETINPYSAGVGWAVKLEKGDFIGRDALRAFRSSPGATRVGLVLGGKRIARQGSSVFAGDRACGGVTSGTFSPTLEKSVAMAFVEPGAAGIGTLLTVDVRGHREPARVVRLPFYKRGSAS
jgi:aminomethyltransferase